MAIVINGNGIDMGGNPVSNASQIEVQENQEVVYGIFQGIALWYTIIFLICYN